MSNDDNLVEIGTMTVTKEDINCGLPENAFNCPIALALEGFLGRTPGHPMVEDNVAEWMVGQQLEAVYRLEPKDDVLNFIYEFDAYGEVEPMDVKVLEVTKEE